MSSEVRPTSFRQSLHLLTLTSLALTQPMLNRIENNAAYLRLERLSPESVLLAVLIILLVPTLSCVLLHHTVKSVCGFEAAWRFQQLCVFSCLVVWIMILSMWLSRTFQLMKLGIPESGFLLVAITVAAFLTRSYSRSLWMRHLLEIAVVGTILFPASLFANSSVRAVLWPTASEVSRLGLTAAQPRSVVMIVLDGVCGMSLLDENHDIDSVRYPSFARLGNISTWYRNASTVYYRTDHAVSALLTGRMPTGMAAGPLESEYPMNLFRILYETGQFEMTVFEPLTRLCPAELQTNLQPRTRWEQSCELLRTVFTVFVKSTWPAELAEVSLEIPHTWFGIASATNLEKQEGQRQGLIIYPWSDFRELQFEHFVNCLYPREKPAFQFLHVVAPHDPWVHLPSGNVYLYHPAFTEFPQGALGNIGEQWSTDPLDAQRGWQRHLLQLQWVDRQLGIVLDQLQSSGMLEDSLLIVAADHGMSFVADNNRREPSNATLPEIMSIPLFIKYPQQTVGIVDDENVEIIDILPTVLDVCGIELEETLDGQSLAAEARYLRPRKTLVGAGSEIITTPDFPERFSVVDKMISVFGSGRNNDRLDRLNTRPELIGRRVDDFSVKPQHQLQTILKSGSGQRPVMPGNWIPCFFEGFLSGTTDQDPPVEIALSLNGMIQATTRTSTDARLFQAWSALLPETTYTNPDNDLGVYQIRTEHGQMTLSPIPVVE